MRDKWGEILLRRSWSIPIIVWWLAFASTSAKQQKWQCFHIFGGGWGGWPAELITVPVLHSRLLLLDNKNYLRWMHFWLLFSYVFFARLRWTIVCKVLQRALCGKTVGSVLYPMCTTSCMLDTKGCLADDLTTVFSTWYYSVSGLRRLLFPGWQNREVQSPESVLPVLSHFKNFCTSIIQKFLVYRGQDDVDKTQFIFCKWFETVYLVTFLTITSFSRVVFSPTILVNTKKKSHLRRCLWSLFFSTIVFSVVTVRYWVVSYFHKAGLTLWKSFMGFWNASLSACFSTFLPIMIWNGISAKYSHYN